MFDSQFITNTLTPILAIVGAVFGVAGTAIGVWNLWLNRRTHKLSVKVTARNQVMVRKGERADGKTVRIESHSAVVRVINNSYFPVTVEEIGVVVRRTRFSRAEYIGLPQGIGRLGERTFRLDPRSAVDIASDSCCWREGDHTRLFGLLTATEYPSIEFARCFYAKLVTGQRFRSSTRGIRDLVAEMKKYARAGNG